MVFLLTNEGFIILSCKCEKFILSFYKVIVRVNFYFENEIMVTMIIRHGKMKKKHFGFQNPFIY